MLGGLFKVSAARSVPARSLAENVQKLPSTDSVRRVRLPALNITIDNIPGKKASVAIYSFLAAKHGNTDDGFPLMLMPFLTQSLIARAIR
eukprot:scaffold172109_cov22-Tisochrysis_lutea.AAC.1